MKKLTYKDSLEFLYTQLPMFSRIGAAAYKPGLRRVINLSKFFGEPHKKFKSIHVGGTNGKGSTSHLLASVLQSAGYRVGLYTSPHLVDFRERMKINGKMIPKKRVVEFVEKWRESNYSGKPSFFELTMIMAFDWFAKEKVDYAVIEVGMGGRLDSTNIIAPELCVITNISHDHNQFLGATLEEIATEKAGIIKKRTPIVIGETQIETAPIFSERAKSVGSEITFADRTDDEIIIEESEKGYGWDINYNGQTFYLPLGGDYQKKNIVTVLQAVKQLRVHGLDIKDKALKKGIEQVVNKTGLAGRWMILSDKPLTIADTGHNIAGLTYNFQQLATLLNRRGGKLRVVIGFVADKAIDKILGILPRDASYYLTNAKIPRALPVAQLKEKFLEFGIEGKSFPGVKEAYKEAQKEASEKDIIFIGGSTFIVADLLT
ncbi:MAG: bifunctional folylpolyglutamate synthase/dihydrofolate synthase [Muribaculaceae bacterium]|nr:bifunctional folylpolyglutamate synthase/dihydrofolate synthase [Muribaculaceae bacterium]